MKRIFGGLLMLAGAFCLYLVATRAMFNGRAELGATYSPGLPLSFVGLDYPKDALLLAGAAWGFILGFWFIVTGADEAKPQAAPARSSARSEEHTSELQSQFHLVCRLLLETKK